LQFFRLWTQDCGCPWNLNYGMNYHGPPRCLGSISIEFAFLKKNQKFHPLHLIGLQADYMMDNIQNPKDAESQYLHT
jgi:hypothetical protein